MSEKTVKKMKQDEAKNNASCPNTEERINLDILQEIGSIGAGHASTALSRLLAERIMVEAPRLHTAPPHLVPIIYGKHERPMTAIYMQLKGIADCDFMLALEIDEAKKIAAMLTMAPSPKEVDSDLKKSAIEELGSIVICAFLSAIADFTGIRLIPAPPEVVNDSFDAVIDFFLAKQALASELAVVFDTRFKRCDSSAEGILVMFPSIEFQKMLADQGKKWLDGISVDTNAINEQKLDREIKAPEG